MTFSTRFKNNFIAANNFIVKKPVTTMAGMLAASELKRYSGVPTIMQFVRSGLSPLQGYQPVAITLGIASAGAASLTIGQSAATVAVVAGAMALLIGGIYKVGVVTGAPLNAAVLQPLIVPGLGCD